MGADEGCETAGAELLSSQNGGAGDILLLGAALHAPVDPVCIDLVAEAQPDAILWITVTRSVDDKLRGWQQHPEAELPDQIGMIDVGGQTHLGRSSESVLDGHSVQIETVSDPRDLTGLGIAVNTVLGKWVDTDTRPVVCFDSITPLLQYSDLRRLFRFLHVFSQHLAEHSGVVHYHLDPTAHDQETINTLLELIDTTVEVGPDGDIEFSHR
ncbi:hypothetical protein BRC93_12505 [Halobacteriales archaeon QS_5_70_15]|nr:MAG: hypothetical protein BRC93_12505 [Halobacteriales archaeon QS_5_70_15]